MLVEVAARTQSIYKVNYGTQGEIRVRYLRYVLTTGTLKLGLCIFGRCRRGSLTLREQQ
jgi:hypothetical protein